MADDRLSLIELAESHAKQFKTVDRRQKEIRRIIDRVKEIFNNEGESFEDGDEKLNVPDTQPIPSFPINMVLIAFLKDALDAATGLTVVLYVMSWIMWPIVYLILFFWIRYRMGGVMWKGAIIRRIYIKFIFNRFITSALIELIPVLNVIPTTTIIVLMAHYKEKKLVRLANLVLEELHKAKIYLID